MTVAAGDNTGQRIVSVAIVAAGVTALLVTATAASAAVHALVALPPLACIWRPDIFHRLGQFLAVLEFWHWGTGLLEDSAHYVGWLVLAGWCVSVLLTAMAGA